MRCRKYLYFLICDRLETRCWKYMYFLICDREWIIEMDCLVSFSGKTPGGCSKMCGHGRIDSSWWYIIFLSCLGMSILSSSKFCSLILVGLSFAVERILKAKTVTAAKPMAPSCGLYLGHVEYDLPWGSLRSLEIAFLIPIRIEYWFHKSICLWLLLINKGVAMI